MSKSLKERIEIEQAFLDGKQLEVDFGQMGHWALFGKTPNPFFNWEWHNYRIKPEPMEFWVNVYDDGTTIVQDSAKGLEIYTKERIIKTIKVREVMEDE